jgi:hypothetical protein|tara:strand:+ start:2179 stop:2355 length:177 start_codon:yes stop_codon:yes gene_type:complete
MKYAIEEFEYNQSANFQTNFDIWFRLVTKERQDWNDEPLDEETAFDIFIGQFGHHRVT